MRRPRQPPDVVVVADDPLLPLGFAQRSEHRGSRSAHTAGRIAQHRDQMLDGVGANKVAQGRHGCRDPAGDRVVNRRRGPGITTPPEPSEVLGLTAHARRQDRITHGGQGVRRDRARVGVGGAQRLDQELRSAVELRQPQGGRLAFLERTVTRAIVHVGPRLGVATPQDREQRQPGPAVADSAQCRAGVRTDGPVPQHVTQRLDRLRIREMAQRGDRRNAIFASAVREQLEHEPGRARQALSEQGQPRDRCAPLRSVIAV